MRKSLSLGCLVVFLCFSLLLFFSCGERQHSNPLDPDFKGGDIDGINTRGIIRLPTAMGSSGLKITSGLHEGSVTSEAYRINLNENAVQLVSLLNSSEQPILLAINVTQQAASPDTLSAASTAEALIFLNPFLCTSKVQDAIQLKTIIRSLPAFTTLRQLVQNQLDAGTFSISESNGQLLNALDQAYIQLITKLTSASLNRLDKLSKITGSTPNPDFRINGLKIIENTQSGNTLSFKVDNTAKRWISVYVDKSTDRKSVV